MPQAVPGLGWPPGQSRHDGPAPGRNPSVGGPSAPMVRLLRPPAVPACRGGHAAEAGASGL